MMTSEQKLLAWLTANATQTVRFKAAETPFMTPAEMVKELAEQRPAVEVSSISALAEESGIPRRTVVLAIGALERDGAIEVSRPTSRTGPVVLEVLKTLRNDSKVTK